MTLTKSVYLLLILLTFSCAEERKYENAKYFSSEDIAIRENLEGEVLDIDLEASPSRIKFASRQNQLILVDNKLNSLLQVYDLEQQVKINNLVRRGQGPGELASITGLQIIENSETLSVSSGQDAKIYLYHLDSLSNDSEVLPFKSISFGEVMLNKPHVVSDEVIIDLRFNFDSETFGRFNVFDFNGQLKKVFGEFPNDGETTKPSMTYEKFLSQLNVNKDHNKIILNHWQTDLIEIYTIEGELISRSHGPDHFFPSVREIDVGGGGKMVAPTTDGYMGFVGPAIGNDELFLVLYDGRSTTATSYHLNRLFMFDIESGLPIKEFALSHPIFNFDVDWENNIIYGLSHEIEENDKQSAIIKYEF